MQTLAAERLMFPTKILATSPPPLNGERAGVRGEGGSNASPFPPRFRSTGTLRKPWHRCCYITPVRLCLGCSVCSVFGAG